MTGLPRSAPSDPLDTARRRIEANLDVALSLADLAGAAGLSTFHFCRQFSARFGRGPIAHLRACRLAAAAARLRAPAPPPLVELAFDSGFESQEGFTRAFVRAYGVPPGRYRSLANAPQETPMTSVIARRLTPLSPPQRKPGLRLAGVARDFDDETKSEIPALWARLFHAWPQAHGRRTFGVNACPPGSDGAEVRYMAAAELAPGEPPPDGLDVMELPARHYLVCRQTLDGGPLHPQMQAGVKALWGDLLPASGARLAAGAPDLETYPRDFEPGRAGAWVEWWVPVEP